MPPAASTKTRATTDTFRRGLATHYMTARSRWTGEPESKPDYVLVAGSEHEGCV